MATRPTSIVALADMIHGQEADLFVLMTGRDELKTRDGKTYYKVAFRDARREVSFPIWADSPWAEDCRKQWNPGAYYKLRATYRDTTYGPQLDIRKIREVTDSDVADGFDLALFVPHSRFDPVAMFDEMRSIAATQISHASLASLVLSILDDNREQLLALPAATRNHHTYYAGYLEHVLSVTRTCIYLAEKYADYYPDMRPPLDVGLVIAGAILHDIGKLREIEWQPEGAAYTAPGRLVGHILKGAISCARRPGNIRSMATCSPARAHHHCPSAAARVGLAQAADDPRGPVGSLCRRHRCQDEHDVCHAA